MNVSFLLLSEELDDILYISMWECAFCVNHLTSVAVCVCITTLLRCVDIFNRFIYSTSQKFVKKNIAYSTSQKTLSRFRFFHLLTEVNIKTMEDTFNWIVNVK